MAPPGGQCGELCGQSWQPPQHSPHFPGATNQVRFPDGPVSSQMYLSLPPLPPPIYVWTQKHAYPSLIPKSSQLLTSYSGGKNPSPPLFHCVAQDELSPHLTRLRWVLVKLLMERNGIGFDIKLSAGEIIPQGLTWVPGSQAKGTTISVHGIKGLPSPWDCKR